jgi:FtsH-binding integral membrane protein
MKFLTHELSTFTLLSDTNLSLVLLCLSFYCRFNLLPHPEASVPFGYVLVVFYCLLVEYINSTATDLFPRPAAEHGIPFLLVTQNQAQLRLPPTRTHT